MRYNDDVDDVVFVFLAHVQFEAKTKFFRSHFFEHELVSSDFI